MTTRSRVREWNFLTIPEIAPDFGQTVGGHPLVAQTLAQRGIDTAEAAHAFLDPAAYSPALPEDLPDLVGGVELLEQAIIARKPILVWGDFDVDGQTATALLLDGLHGLDAEVHCYVPHRLHESHGIQPSRLKSLIQQYNPEVLLTCDTGISAHEAIDYANRQGLTVIVTDHHDLPPDLPPAAALINPKRLPEGHRLRTLPGAGVAFKLIQALYTRTGRENELHRLLDLVALGIVADVAEQTNDTRYLLQMGLGCLRRTQRLGVRALVDVAGLSMENLSADDIGFQLGPRLNAVGRLGDAMQAVELLTTQDPTQARVLAANLDGLNRQRRVLQRQILAAAQEQIAARPELLDHTALVLHHPAWHPGLLGVVAGQLAELYQRPCVLLGTLENEPLARGSARSIPGYDIGRAIAAQADLLHSYGGHSGAAGLSLLVDDIPVFRRRLSSTLQELYQEVAAPPLEIAAEVPLKEVTPDLASEIERLAPFGPGNPPVILAASNLTLAGHQYLDREHLHRKLTVQDETGTKQGVLWWDGAEHALPAGPFDLAFTVGWSTYQGKREMALTLEALRLRVPADVIPASRLIVEDWRTRTADPDLIEAFLQQEADGVIWAEGPHTNELREKGSPVHTRHQIPQAAALLIYTVPPVARVLQTVLDDVKPLRVYVAGIPPAAQDMNNFLQRLLGLCKYTVDYKDGRADLNALGGAAAQSEEAVYWGLRWLAARNAIRMEEQGEDLWIAAPSGAAPTLTDDEQEAAAALRAILAESAAYRTFFSRAPIDTLQA